MKENRRTFLKLCSGAAVALGAGAWWGARSDQRAARWLRRILADSVRGIAAAPLQPSPQTWSRNSITLAWIGHATVLINFYGVHILTDPAFGARVGLQLGFGTAGPKRFIAPALRIRDLPPIDLVLLSHAHMDHLDLPSLRLLDRDVPIITAHLTGDVVRVAGTRDITELGWSERTRVNSAYRDVEVEAFEVKHWGKRWPSELERGYNGYVLRRGGKALIFAGDTAHTPLFADLRSKGPFEAAIMPIGSYDPWIRNHCTPEQAVEMANLAGAKYVVPIHHQTFRLSNEPMNEPIERLEAALANERERLALAQVGETFVLPA